MRLSSCFVWLGCSLAKYFFPADMKSPKQIREMPLINVLGNNLHNDHCVVG